MVTEPAMIDPTTFADSHVFSFRKQPYLKLMFNAVCDTRQPITLVAGAGVSMNASLPSWQSLISRIAGFIEDPDLRTMAIEDKSDPMRKAEIILHLVKTSNPNPEEYEFVRDALYQRDRIIAPGQLALSIARLAVARNHGLRLLTTNFDDILEQALCTYIDPANVKGFSLDEVEEWKRWAGQGRAGVLHLHGLLRQGSPPKHPIVLTESQFLKHGAKVRDTVSDALANSPAIFVGLSIADPNLVGPLYQTESAKHDRFALAVPRQQSNESPTESTRFAIESAKYFEKRLGLKPIFLKSYSQLNQVLSDLSLALVHPRQYRPRPADRSPSLVYGRRLTKALESCYEAIGCKKKHSIPTGDAAHELNKRLYEALHKPGGPVSILRTLGQKYSWRQDATTERFALFLWLRARRLSAKVDPPYSLNLVGTSAYTHREAWSMQREEAITDSSRYAAVQAVFDGTLKVANLDPVQNTYPWRGVFAAPIRLTHTACSCEIDNFPVDTLTVGAIALQSTHQVDREDGVRHTAAPNDYSIISRLDSSDFNKLMAALEDAATSTIVIYDSATH